MIIGHTIFPNTTSPQAYYYTPWMSRGGDFGVFSIDIIDVYDSAGTPAMALTVEIQTKNSEEADSAATVISTAISLASGGFSLGTHSQEFSGAEELVRFRFKLAGVRGTDWLRLRALNITWATN